MQLLEAEVTSFCVVLEAGCILQVTSCNALRTHANAKPPIHRKD